MSPYKLTYDEFHQIVRQHIPQFGDGLVIDFYNHYEEAHEQFMEYYIQIGPYQATIKDLESKEKLNLLKETIDAL